MAVASVEERELLKTISWFDGFVVALANPSFLITAIGGSALSLGGWGAAILWTVSVLLGALHNYIYSETAAMFPKLSGGIAIYAHEAWKRYFSFIGPIAAFGYWIGWSVVLSATGVVVGFFVQYEWYPSSATSTSWNHTWSVFGQTIYFNFPIALTALIIVVIWAFNVSGMRPAVWVGYVTGAPADAAARGDDVPALPDRRLAQLQHAQQHQCDGGLAGREQLHADHRLAVRDVLVGLRHGVLCDLRAGVPRHRARHAEGAAGRGRLRRDHLRPAADGRHGHVRRPEPRHHQHLHVHARHAATSCFRVRWPGWRSSRCARGSCWR